MKRSLRQLKPATSSSGSVRGGSSYHGDFSSQLRRHRLSSFDLGIPQVLTTERQGQGDWGLKRSLPASRIKEVIVENLDSRERQTVFRSGAGHARFIERMQHIAPRLNSAQARQNARHYFGPAAVTSKEVDRSGIWERGGLDAIEAEAVRELQDEEESIENIVRIYRQEIEGLSLKQFTRMQAALGEWRQIHRLQPDLFPVRSLHDVLHHFVHLSPIAGGLVYSSPVSGSLSQSTPKPDPLPAHVLNGARSTRMDGTKSIAVGLGGLVAHCQIKDSALSRMVERRLDNSRKAKEQGLADYSAMYDDHQENQDRPRSTMADPEGLIPPRTYEVYSLDRLWVQPLTMTISKEGQLYLTVEAVPASEQVKAERQLYESKGKPIPLWIAEYDKIQERHSQDRATMTQYSQARQARLLGGRPSENDGLSDLSELPLSSSLKKRLSEQLFRKQQDKNPYVNRFNRADDENQASEGQDANEAQSRLVQGIQNLSKSRHRSGSE